MPSSVIRCMRYHPAERTLDITFRDGRGVYRYFDVPVAEWERFRSAASKGTYLNKLFKEGGYGYEKIGTEKIGTLRRSPLQSEELVWGEWSDEPQ